MAALRVAAAVNRRTLEITIETDSVEVAQEVLRSVQGIALGVGRVVGLGVLYAGYHLLQPLVNAAVIRAFGGDRDDQDLPDIRPGCLHVELHCCTDERFLEVLADYESGRIKERLQEELSQVGIKVEGLKVKIENMEEVNETKAAIETRYRITKDPGEMTMNIDTSESEECSASSSFAKAFSATDLLEEANFSRLARLLIGKGTEALRNEFDAINPPARLPAVLAANQKSLLRLKFRVINKSQWDLMYPPSGKPPDSKTFDVSLLTVLFRNICGLPSTGWDAVPLDTDRSMQANIIRIKTLRNEVFTHASSTRLDSAQFASLWKKIAQALVELNIPQKDIDELKESPLSPEEVNSVEVLRNWKLILESLLERVVDPSTDVKDMKSDVKDIKKLRQLDIQQQSDEVPSQSLATRSSQFQEYTKIEINRHNNEALLQSLTKYTFEGKIRKKVKYFLPGTREWLLKDVDDWFTENDQESRILLLTAGPGFGKSVFASKVCEIFKEKGKLAACHFCDFSDANLQNPMMMLQSLASQMCENVPGFKENLLDQLKRPNEICTIKEAFRKYLQNPLDELKVGEPSLVVIDGLDESAADDRSDIVDLIAECFSELPDCIKFLITSRPEISIAKLEHIANINIDNNHRKNKSDIETYLKFCLQNLLESGKNSSGVIKSLVEMCEGSFLYAYYAQSELKKRDDPANLSPDEIVEFPPKGIASIYQKYFRRLEDELKYLRRGSLDVLKVLELLVSARGPLPLSFVAKALGLAPDCRENKRIINKVNEAISCLLYVAKDEVTVFHKSVIDWLPAQGYEDHEYAVTISDGNKSLWLICEETFERIKKNILGHTEYQQNVNIHEMYALKYGFSHLVECNLRECFYWLMDVAIVFAILLYDNDDEVSTADRLQASWTAVLQEKGVISDQIRERISWQIVELNYFSKFLIRGQLPWLYLEGILTRSPNGCFDNDEKMIAQSLLANISLLSNSTNRWDNKTDVDVMPIGFWNEDSKIIGLDLSNDNRMAAIATEDRTISLSSVPSLQNLWKWEADFDISCCTFAPDDSFLLLGKLETVLNIAARKEVPFFFGTRETFVSSAFSPNGKRLITCNGSSTIKLWDVAKRCLISTLCAGVQVDSCSFDKTGLFIMAYKNPDDTDSNHRRNENSSTKFNVPDEKYSPSNASVSFATNHSDGKLDHDSFCVWNTLTLQRCDERNLQNSKNGNTSYSKLCRRCVRSGSGIPPTYKLCKCTESSERYWKLPCGRGISSGIYDGVDCFFALGECSLSVIENTHFTTLAILSCCIVDWEDLNDDKSKSDDEFCVRKKIFRIDNDHWLYKSSLQLVVLKIPEPIPPTTVYCISFSPDSSRLATCTSDGCIKIWNVDTKQVEQHFEANRGEVPFLCWWSKEFLYVFEFFDKLPSLMQYSVDINSKILFTESQQVSLPHLSNKFVSVTQVVDFSGGLLCLKCEETKPVEILDVNGSGAPQFITLPGIQPMMNITISPDCSFISSVGEDMLYIWKRNSANEALYDVFFTGQLPGERQKTACPRVSSCFSNDSKVLVILGQLGERTFFADSLDLETGNFGHVLLDRNFSSSFDHQFCIHKSRIIISTSSNLIDFHDMDFGARIWSSIQNNLTNERRRMKLSPDETILAFSKLNGEMEFLRLSIPQDPLLGKIKDKAAAKYRDHEKKRKKKY